MHMHGVVVDVQLISQVGIVASSGLLLKVPAFASVKNLVNLLGCSAWASYEMDNFVVSSNSQSFDVLVCELGWEVWPCVHVVTWAFYGS